MYRIIITHHFKRQLKPLFKKDRGLKERFIESILTPLCIYAKSDQESISAKELAQHLEKVDRELRYLLS